MGELPPHRPRTAVGRYRKEIEDAKHAMANALGDATQALIDKARGLFVCRIYDHQTQRWRKPPDLGTLEQAIEIGPPLVRIYQEPPDLAAILALQDRIMGKVPTPVDLEVRTIVLNAITAQATILELIERKVPAEYLADLADELGRLHGQHREAAAYLGGLDAAAPPDPAGVPD